MIDHKQVVEKIIKSIKEFSFEFDIEEVKKQMELQEVSDDELKSLGQEKVNENFNNGIFKIKMPNGALIDASSIKKQSIEKNIEEPVVYINPNFKYVKWIVKKDFTTHQIKQQIKNQLTSNSEINIIQLKKELLNKETKNKEIDGYINDLPIKTSDNVNQGTFYIQSSCSTESAIKMVYEVLGELEKEKLVYVVTEIKKDHIKIVYYFIFLVAVSALWFINKECKTIPTWLSTTIAFVLFLISFIVMRLIDHTIFDALLHRKKAENKYTKAFYDNASNE